MDDRTDEPGRQVPVREVQPGTAHFEQVLILAARVLAQDRNLTSRIPHALESHLLASSTSHVVDPISTVAGTRSRPAPGHEAT
jgi:hypothetical protein